ncbi:DKNYY domain-containing protein, partial [Leptotrichia hofstadii]
MNIKGHLLKILLLFVLVGSIVNAGYLKEKIKFISLTQWKILRKRSCENIDFRTFKIFEENDNFAKDKDNVYYKNKKLENVDA